MPLETRFTRTGSTLRYRNNPACLAGIYPPTRDDCEKEGHCADATEAACGIEALDLGDPAMNQAMDRLQSRRNNFFRFPLLPYWQYASPEMLTARSDARSTGCGSSTPSTAVTRIACAG